MPEEQAVTPLAGGILQRGRQCGIVWGAALAAGAEAYRRLGAGPAGEAAALQAVRQVVAAFRERNGSIDCFELTGIDWTDTVQGFKFLLSGGPVRCARLVAGNAPLGFEQIQLGLAEPPAEDLPSGPGPISCAAELARRMGADERQVVMTAGLAGGIGLVGSGCGALGAAVWLTALRGRAEGLDAKAITARCEALLERFADRTAGELDCSAIVGRRFEDPEDHAAFLQRGGCGGLIELLAAGALERTG